MDSFLLGVLASILGALIFSIFVFIFKKIKQRIKPSRTAYEAYLRQFSIMAYICIPLAVFSFPIAIHFNDIEWLYSILTFLTSASTALSLVSAYSLHGLAKELHDKYFKQLER